MKQYICRLNHRKAHYTKIKITSFEDDWRFELATKPMMTLFSLICDLAKVVFQGWRTGNSAVQNKHRYFFEIFNRKDFSEPLIRF